jgi:hypothetical protein
MGEVFFAAVLSFEEVYVKDEGRFGFMMDRVDFFKGEGVSFAENGT